MENRVEELASIVEVVDDLALEPKWRLAPRHVDPDGQGARHLSELRARLAPAMLRRVRREVIAQLPERTDTRVPVELTAEQRAEHDELDRPIAVLAATAARRPLTHAEFLRLMSLLATQRVICNGLAQLRFEETWERIAHARPTEALLASLFTPKLAALRTLVGELAVAQERKVVVFSQWKRMLRLAEWAVRDVLAGAGKRAVFFTGDESPRQRERALVELHDDPRTAVMFLSDAGGVGLNLQRAASACIQLELPWNPAVLEQRIGRIHRLGQSRPIDVYHLVTEEGIESRIAGLVADKRALFTSLFDGTSDEVAFDRSASFMATVRALVDPSVPAITAGEAASELDETLTDVALDETERSTPPPPTSEPSAPAPSPRRRPSPWCAAPTAG